MDNNFLTSYFRDLSQLIEPDQITLEKLILLKKKMVEVHKDGKKTLIFGNGGSAAMASHFSVDMTKNAGIRCVNYNEADLITCFANDFGFENWVAKAVELYGDAGDLLILISSSGKSLNMIKAVESARKVKFSSVATFSGFKEDNPLNTSGDISLWVNSKAYNFVENTHQIWLLSLVDLIIGSREYSA